MSMRSFTSKLSFLSSFERAERRTFPNQGNQLKRPLKKEPSGRKMNGMGHFSSILSSQPQTSTGSNLSSVGSESNLEQFVSPYFLTWNRASRSNSWSDPVPTADDAAASNVITSRLRRDSIHEAEENRGRVAVNWAELLDPDQGELYESLKTVYANILMNWGLLTGTKDNCGNQTTEERTNIQTSRGEEMRWTMTEN